MAWRIANDFQVCALQVRDDNRYSRIATASARPYFASFINDHRMHPDVADASVDYFQGRSQSAVDRAVRTEHRLGLSRHIDSSESHFSCRRIAEPPSPRRSVGFCIRDFIYHIYDSDVLLMHDATVKPSVFTSWTDTT